MVVVLVGAKVIKAPSVRHKTLEVFYKNIGTTLLFQLVLGNMPPVGSRGLVRAPNLYI